MLNRRAVLAGGAVLAAASVSEATAARTPAAEQSVEERVRAAARDARKQLDYREERFSGAAYEWLVAKGRSSSFFLHGEEHGIAENPKLAAQLFRDLMPAGYAHAAVEISAPMAWEIDRVLAEGGLPALIHFLAEPRNTIAFFGMREETEWLAAARAVAPGKGPVIWGCDYEVAGDRHLIALLKSMRAPATAQAALARVEAASEAAWARYDKSRNLLEVFGFSGHPALIRDLRAAWPKPGRKAAWILDTLEQTLSINRAWSEKLYYRSNELRAANLRANFRRQWTEAGSPRVYMKFGATHLLRGLTGVGTFDMGSLLPELAEARGERAFSIMVLPGNDARTAVLNPATLRYAASAPKDQYQKGLSWVIDEAWRDAFTLFDCAALRAAVNGARGADPELIRAVNGYDAIIVMSGSTPSSNLA